MKRLEAITSQITPCACLADIGSDHGLIALSALPYAKKIIVTDISETCLSKARELLKDYENVTFSAGDGLKALGNDIGAVDCMAICGMGGYTICGILEGYCGGAKLILQPQSDVKFVREFLIKHSFAILNDFLAYERGKFYDIIVCKYGNAEQLNELQLNFGKFFDKDGNKDEDKDGLGKRRLKGLEKKYASYPPNEKNTEFLRLIKQALKEVE